MPIDLPFPRVQTPEPRALPGRGCDCTSCAFWMGTDGNGGPSTIEPLCSGTNASCSYCACARTEASAPTDACRTCPIRCGSRTDIAAWLNDVGQTLRFTGILLHGRLPDGLPRLIPQVDGTDIRPLDVNLRWPAYAVGLRRVFSQRSNEIYPRFRKTSAHRALGLRADQLAVLVGYGTDPLVEAFWSKRHAQQLIAQIAQQAWDLVLAPNYSVYGNWPRVEHLLNMRRSLVIAQEMAQEGICVVPNIYWYRLEDLRRWAEWIQTSQPLAIAINLQTVRRTADWDNWALPGLHWLAAQIPEDMPVVLTGLSRTDRIRLAVQLFGARLAVVSQNPYQYAMHGAAMTAEGRMDMPARPAETFSATVRYMAQLIEPGQDGQP